MKLSTSMVARCLANPDPMPSSIGCESLPESFPRGLLVPWGPTRRGRWSSGLGAPAATGRRQPTQREPAFSSAMRALPLARPGGASLRPWGEVPAVLVAATGMYQDSFQTAMRSGAPHRPRCTFGAPFAQAVKPTGRSSYRCYRYATHRATEGNAESAVPLTASRRLRPFPVNDGTPAQLISLVERSPRED
jgi:hypothetical protein